MQYRKMYFQLLNAITDAIAQIDSNNFGNAAEILKDAKKTTEEICIKQSFPISIKQPHS